MSDAIANFAYTTVTAAPSPATSGTSLTVESGSVLPTPPFNATVWPAGSIPLGSNAEIVRVTANAAGVLTVTRTQEGSSARTIKVGDQFAAMITKKIIEDIRTAAVLAGSTQTVAAGGNVFLGELSGVALTTGKENAGLGTEALKSLTSGVNNAALGQAALKALTTGSNNVGVGFIAGLAITTASNNTALGSEALVTNKVGEGNTAMGRSALKNATGKENTGIGWGALVKTTTGEENSALGSGALEGNTTGTGNAALGAGAGSTNLTGSSNVYLGYHAGRPDTAQSNKLYIHNATVATAATESLVYGDFSTREFRVNATTLSLYKGVTPVAQAATFAALGEAGSSTTKQLEEQSNKIRAIIRGVGLAA